MGNISILSLGIESTIQKCIDEKFEEYHVRDAFPNALLREDVLDLLDRFCTVVYYPLDNEENNGFHITDMPFSDGTKNHFVYINTAQTMEKQVFTAAHELGHIWQVDDYVLSKHSDLTPSTELREQIINRFAAVLLIPGVNFAKAVRAALDSFGDPKTRTIPFGKFLRMVVVLMNQFFAPMKAVVLRLFEYGVISEEVAAKMLERDSAQSEDIAQHIDDIISEFKFTKFQTSSRKKWIEGLAEKLDFAEKHGLVPQSKIDHLRTKFELASPSENTTGMDAVVTITTKEGLEE